MPDLADKYPFFSSFPASSRNLTLIIKIVS